MAKEIDLIWESTWDAPTRRDRAGGHYSAYLPDPLLHRPLVISSEIAVKAAHVESMVSNLTSQPGAHGLEGLARFLLRSEAIASSRIEGLQASAQQIALAELAVTENLASSAFTYTAKLIANNIITLRKSVGELAAAPTLEIDGICALQQMLLPHYQHLGLRTVQNWLGGSNYHPLGAHFVPPPAEYVVGLMEDLALYATGAIHSPLIQAALVHAQFETIHPFADGNGRVGRALIHTVLTRRGLTKVSVLPISLVLLTRSDEYVAGLNSYRYLGPPDTETAWAGVGAWIEIFLNVTEVAVSQAQLFVTELEELRAEWTQQYTAYRAAAGLRAIARADSAVTRLLDILPEVPVVTARTVQDLLQVSFPSARTAVEELANAGILRRKQVDRGTTGYLARSVFDLLNFAERQLASTQWDTRKSKPRRQVPPPRTKATDNKDAG